MSTDGNLPDLKFPQSGGQGNSIHLSANTLKQHGRNGKTPKPPESAVIVIFITCVQLCARFLVEEKQSIEFGKTLIKKVGSQIKMG